LPLLLKGFKQIGSYFPNTTLEGADLKVLITSGGEALQLPENVAAAQFGIGDQPGHDLLPLAIKGVFLGTPPAQHAFSPLLLPLQSADSCCRIGDAPLIRNVSRRTTFHRKDAKRCRWWAGNTRRATDGTTEDGLLQLLHLLEEVDRVERVCHLGQFLLLLGWQDA
jgi:hypothetical protein